MGLEVEINHKRTEAERSRERRARGTGKICDPIYDARRKRESRASAIPHFIGVDSEGIGQGSRHRAVLISAFDEAGEGAHYVARNKRIGLQWEEVFEFLYDQFETFKGAAFVGFFLGYDFNNWLCYRAGFPQQAAFSLLSPAGKKARKLKSVRGRSKFRSVKVDRWEVDMLGFKRLSIRPRPEGCTCYEQAIKCEHKQHPWMHICDSGSFFQMSLLAVLNKKNWRVWPITQTEYDIILEGKNRRDHATLDKAMMHYNKLENMILCRVMRLLAEAFQSIGIKIAKDQWYGPGATASKWLQNNGIPKRSTLRTKQDDGTKALMPEWFWDDCHKSYYGGWFEIFSHGIIQGTSYNYDINNAYPYAATRLPHICGECRYRRGRGEPTSDGPYVLVYATVFSRSDRIGPVPYREKDGTILRPRVSKGWYWRFEIDAAARAGLVKQVMYYEWAEFIPCTHPEPMRGIRSLYNRRLEVGKDTAEGMAIKLNNNSIYGKFAQSVGSAPYGNWFYASYITAHCRTQILNAISSHPNQADSVLMVATDGICFDSPHPYLPVSKELGEWAQSEYEELVLFKPGVYWHKVGKDNLLKVKSRGVPRDAFLEACQQAEAQFEIFSMHQAVPGWIVGDHYELDEVELALSKAWPNFFIPVTFRMRSCRQALNEGNWNGSAVVLDEIYLKQDSDPSNKRRTPRWNWDKKRIDTTIRDVPIKQLQTTYHGDAEYPKPVALGFGFEGETVFGPIIEAAGILRDAPVNYDLNLQEAEWVNVWG